MNIYEPMHQAQFAHEYAERRKKLNIYYETIQLADKKIFLKIITERYDKNPKIIIMNYQDWIQDQKEWNIEENKNNNNKN